MKTQTLNKCKECEKFQKRQCRIEDLNQCRDEIYKVLDRYGATISTDVDYDVWFSVLEFKTGYESLRLN